MEGLHQGKVAYGRRLTSQIFFLDAWGEDVVVRRTDCSLDNVLNRLFLHFLEAVTILGMDDAAPFDIESSRNLTRAVNASHCP